ncbi:hypothetical protein [Sedimentisphaera salicampi]|uniref:hypothetical protein n=1 Tax=Sedimentisphaera salicampi TaxID=1941349 RepID=UPI000B9B2819|nr:hypothetical protein [Sedimentisphaera salicampi]OXU15614.1 hypothetical protein SMSP1_00697 [Sedimentisphaera salicampi]
MPDLITKIKGIRDKLLKEGKELRLFALFKKENEDMMWDLVVSANWAQDDYKKAIGEISQLLQKELSDEELLMISAIYVVTKEDSMIKVLSGFAGKMKDSHIQNCNINGIQIREAFVLEYNPAI